MIVFMKIHFIGKIKINNMIKKIITFLEEVVWWNIDFYLDKFIYNPKREIKYAWQRVFRGWDDTACWGIDDYFLLNFTEILKRFKEKLHGFPISVGSEKKWKHLIQQMIDGFEAGKRVSWATNWEGEHSADEAMLLDRKDTKKLNKSLLLFVKYFDELWD